jgi:hypothetical protein
MGGGNENSNTTTHRPTPTRTTILLAGLRNTLVLNREVLRAYLDALRAAACQRPIEHAAQSLDHAAALLAPA